MPVSFSEIRGLVLQMLELLPQAGPCFLEPAALLLQCLFRVLQCGLSGVLLLVPLLDLVRPRFERPALLGEPFSLAGDLLCLLVELLSFMLQRLSPAIEFAPGLLACLLRLLKRGVPRFLLGLLLLKVMSTAVEGPSELVVFFLPSPDECDVVFKLAHHVRHAGRPGNRTHDCGIVVHRLDRHTH